MDVSDRIIVMLGKTGAGKSSLANTIFGEKLFRVDHSPNSETRKCRAETKSVNGRSITLIDTPGFFDTDSSEEEMKPEIVRCITECAPGPHAFLIVLKVEKFTEQEQAVITEIRRYFSEEAFKYATVVFTHGDQLPEGQTIEEYVHQNQDLSDLVNKCGGRCHVIDNKYWNGNPKEKYRSNQFQVETLLNMIEKTLTANSGSCYTNDTLQEVEEEIQQEEEHIRLLSGNMSKKEIREQAKGRVFKKLLIKVAGTSTGVLLGAFFGVVVMVVGVVATSKKEVVAKTGDAARAVAVGLIGVNAAGGAGGAARAAGISLSALAATSATAGAVRGGVTGYHAAEGADTPWEAAMRAAEAVKKDAQSVLDRISQPKLKHS